MVSFVVRVGTWKLIRRDKADNQDRERPVAAKSSPRPGEAKL